MKSISLVFAGVIASLIMSAAPSSAYGDNPNDGKIYQCGRNGNFPLCLYWGSNLTGAKVGIFGKVHNYQNNPWNCSSQGCGSYWYSQGSTLRGYGEQVKNNTASVYNYNDTTMRVFYNSGWGGPANGWDPYGWGTYFGNLTVTYNENASQARVCGEC